ncbi:hypothetical protein CPB83DRAFT_326976 [Crepidotus variabilis]|uniref:Uncharacterized protein n=1 Tax=Crepidotus variabilis TaxID=179855 RepID=A0A9P6JW87_9AGAR|nr:hypothetical protein CPB83DRAFT_326976 [Crepidotus variabilis]
MSRLAGSGFGKPSPFEFPRHGLPPSPPETHRENISGAPPILSAPSFGAQDIFPLEAALASASPDLFGARVNPRKGSSIPYHSSPIPRETHRSTGSRTKALILVLPPSTLLQEPGPSSQIVSNTPFHRLSQGVLLPLFPSLFSQLTAIAKEFNFPSTSGLVLYYHIVENGVSFTPRISEDSWQTIWTHLAEAQERPPLISGKVEFDIDLRLARWYSTWLSALRREVYEYTSAYHPSTAPSMAHFRGESRTTMADKTFNEDDSTEILQPPLRPLGSRHVPRKLSLVERLDLDTSKSVMSPPESNSGKPRPLSTIAQEVQEDEPKTGKSDLVSRVKNWRASASIAPTSLIATGQPSLNPVNLPNNMNVPTEEEETELRMSDFAWSISSAGPSSPVEGSVSSRSRVPSIHITQRMAGSVATTESYRTSSGPSDYDPLSPISWSYPPSIHLANRLEGSVCSTASYRTSSGPSDYDPYSPLIASSHLPTPDIARRFLEDTPATPQTSTSWGALSWPPSPHCFSPTPSLDLGERAMYDEESAPNRDYLRSADRKPWEHVWPYTEKIPVLPPTAFEDMALSQPWIHMWPYMSYSEEEDTRHETKPYSNYLSNDASVKLWSHAWPSYQAKASTVISKSLMENPLLSASSYPNMRIYAPVYPHLEIYPSVPCILQKTNEVNSSPLSRGLSVRAPTSYPAFNLYPSVYPYNLQEIYPSIQIPEDRFDSEGYPYFYLYPSKAALLSSYLSLYSTNPRGQYPHFEILDPSSGQINNSDSLSQFSLSTTHPICYPALNIYPAVYPHFDLYPATTLPTENLITHVSVSLAETSTPGSGYPAFNLYPAIYPNFDLYPTPYYEAIQDRAVLETAIHGEAGYFLTAATTSSYPSFNLYPPVYPYFDLYPAPYFSRSAPLQSSKHGATSSSRYPTFDLYPAVYPYFDLYPAVLTEIKSPPSLTSPRLRVRPTSRLPVPVRGPPSPRPTRVKSTSRLTHSELHAMVMMEKFGSNLPPLTPPRRVEARHTPQRSSSDSVHGLPASPASGIRRQASLADRRMSYIQNAEASSMSPVTRRPSQRQSVFGARKRDSLVLQKVRAFDTNDHVSSPSSVRESPSRLPRSFPPLPAVPVDHDAY